VLFLVEMRQRAAMPSEPQSGDELRDRVCGSLAALDTDSSVHGGVVAGCRAVVFVVEREDIEALDRWLQDLPLWTVVEDVRVTPLISFRARLAYNRGVGPSR
jgi:hypothetical protein